MDGGFSCIQCGYPLGHAGDGASPPYGACPECGSSQAHSWERWSQLGGQTAALKRLMLASSLTASLAIAIAVIELARPWLVRQPPHASDLSTALAWSLGLVTLALGAAAWKAWRSAERDPPFSARSRIPIIPKIALGLWCVAATSLLVNYLAPHIFYSAGTIPVALFGTLMMFAMLPTSVVMAALTQCALPTRPFVWRWRQAPTLVIACVLLFSIIAYVVLTLLYAFTSLNIEGLEVLSKVVVPLLLPVLAAVQLRLLRWAAATVQPPATLAAVEHVLLRRTWIGAVVLPAVLLLGVAFVHVFVYGMGGTTRLAVSDGADALFFIGVVGGVIVLWLIAAQSPLYVLRRAIRRAMTPSHANGP